MSIRWEHFVNSFDSRSTYLPGSSIEGPGGKHGLYVREFASVVSIFQERTDSLIDMYTETSRTIDSLSTCPYTTEAFGGLLASIQKTIDSLNLEGYANLDSWVAELDAKIETVLLDRLRLVVDRWCVEFGKGGEGANGDTISRKKATKEVLEVSSLSLSLSEYVLILEGSSREWTVDWSSRRSCTRSGSRTKSSTSTLPSNRRVRAGIDSFSSGWASSVG